MPYCRGYYLFIFKLREDLKVLVGSLGLISLEKGIYGYLGSSFTKGGVLIRISRHLIKNKIKRWHIDYLTSIESVEPVEAMWVCSEKRGLEAELALCIGKFFEYAVKGFGSSDSIAYGHLFKLQRSNAYYVKNYNDLMFNASLKGLLHKCLSIAR